jgi:cold shock CspA family protein
MHHGTVKTYGSRGFGFIARRHGPDIWFHMRDSPSTPEHEFQPGRNVTFSVIETSRNTRAVDVRIAEVGQ